MRIARAGQQATKRSRPKAEEGNAAHVAAPMPGMIATVVVKPGQTVTKGATLLSVEAMKMEAAITVDRDATVLRVHVAPGDRVDAKDLLIELA
jgi:pyruvate carboxylase